MTIGGMCNLAKKTLIKILQKIGFDGWSESCLALNSGFPQLPISNHVNGKHLKLSFGLKEKLFRKIVSFEK